MDTLETPRPARITGGEWLGEDHPGYRGEVVGFWNGFADWRCTFEVACDVVEDQQRMLDGMPEEHRECHQRLVWAIDEDEVAGPGPGDAILVLNGTDPMFEGCDDQVIEPDDDGMYHFNQGWVWEAHLDEPLAPTTDEQRRTHRRLKAELRAATSAALGGRGGMLVHSTHHDDGSDTFRPAFTEGAEAPYKSVRIHPDGTTTKEV